MSNRLLAGLAACVVAAGCAGRQGAPPQDLAATLDERNRQVFALLQRGQHEEVADRYYTDDVLLLPPGGEAIRGKAAASAFWRRQPQSPPVTLQTEVARIDAFGSSVLHSGLYSVGSARGAFVLLWRRVDGNWRIALDAWN